MLLIDGFIKNQKVLNSLNLYNTYGSTLSFLFKMLKVPKDEILILFDLIIANIIDSKKSSTIFKDKFFEKPTFLYILLDKSFRVKLLFTII